MEMRGAWRPQPSVSEIAAGLERLFALIRSLSPPGLSFTAGATLNTLERSGPCRLTALAAAEGVTQPAMTQLVSRLADSGLGMRGAGPDEGRSLVARGRATRAERLSSLLTRLSEADQAALAAALPAMNALVNLQHD